jgi:uncharacterized protein YjbJ (UPF0337 family)
MDLHDANLNKLTLKENIMFNANKAQNANEKLHKEIKKTWTKLTDDNIKLYSTKPADFFAKLKEKHNVSKEDAKKKIAQLEKDCGCGSVKAA